MNVEKNHYYADHPIATMKFTEMLQKQRKYSNEVAKWFRKIRAKRELKKKIHELYNDHNRIIEISRMLKLSPQTVSKELKR
jgi:AraC-like DNA-binding protein